VPPEAHPAPGNAIRLDLLPLPTVAAGVRAVGGGSGARGRGAGMAAAASMQLLGLAVTGPREGAEPVILASASDLSQFSFFQRGA
jgi:hypothetical protein